MRSKYYVPWLISQLAIDFAGLSYNRVTNSFDKYENARPVDTEIRFMDAKRRVATWNMGVQRWLKSTFYDRFEKKFGKSTASMRMNCIT